MALFEYACLDCGKKYEFIENSSKPARSECPDCLSHNFSRQIPKYFGAHFQGSGFYETDYKRVDKTATNSAPHCGTSSCGCTSTSSDK